MCLAVVTSPNVHQAGGGLRAKGDDGEFRLFLCLLDAEDARWRRVRDTFRPGGLSYVSWWKGSGMIGFLP